MLPRFGVRRGLGWLLAAVLAVAASAPDARAQAGVEPNLRLYGQPALGVPDWLRGETVYEINVRQYSEAGTFAAVRADLGRIRDLGVGVLWFMPIHPIGEAERKGPLGSYYAIRDYRGVNPEFGTAAEWRALVEAAQAMGMRVVMDWVANHTAPDHPWVTERPEFYVRDAAGRPVPPRGTDWVDVVQLDFDRREVWEEQIAAMLYWINEYGIDGFRCDFAKGGPTAFWDEVSARLRAVRPDVWLLSEAETPQHLARAFHTVYGFDLMHAINAIAAGRASASRLDDELAHAAVSFPAGSSLLVYTSNHDENSWQGTVFERLGGGVEVFAVLTFLWDGVPLIYNGQEAGLDKRLEFFERDPITWRAHPLAEVYRRLTGLRRENRALHTGSRLVRVPTTANAAIFAVVREAQERRVVGFLNFTGEEVKFTAAHRELVGAWREVGGEEAAVELDAVVEMTLPAWGYRLLQQ